MMPRMNNLLELSGWKLVEGVTRLLKGPFLTKEQAMKVCAVALECVHDTEEEELTQNLVKR
jgi:hypothetical protein